MEVGPDRWALRAAHRIPKRLYRGPIWEMGIPIMVLPLRGEDLLGWMSLANEVPGWRLYRTIARYWADGQRSLAEIARLVALETGRSIGPTIELYFNLREKMGLVRIETKD